MGILNGSIFEDQHGKRYRYTGEDDGVPDYNDPTTFEELKDPIQEQTEEVLDEPSAITDLGRVAYGTFTGLGDAVVDVVGSAVTASEDELIELKTNINKSLINALPAPQKIKDSLFDSLIDPTTGRRKKTQTVTGTVAEVGTFLTGVGAAKKVLGKGASKASEAVRWFGAEQAAEQLLADPDSNIANFVQEMFPETLENNPVMDYLAADEDDEILEKRAKMAISSGLTGAAIGGTLEAIKGGIKVTGYGLAQTGKAVKNMSNAQLDGLAGDILLAAKNSNLVPKLTARKQNAAKQDEELAQVLSQTGNLFSSDWKNAIKRFGKRYLTSRGFLTEEGFKAQRQSLQNQREIISRSEHITQRLKNFIDEDVVRLGDESIANKVQEALTATVAKKEDKASINYFVNNFGLSKELAEQVLDARGLIDELSENILGTGLTTKKTSEVIAAQAGSYLRRSYKLFEDKGWKPSEDLKNDTIKKIMEESDLSATEAGNIVTNILQKGDAEEFNSYISAARAGTRQILTKKKEIPEHIRKLMGEIEDPVDNILLTATKMAQVSENFKFLARIRELGEGKYIFSEANRLKVENGAELFKTQISGTNTKLDGMYTTPEMARVLKGTEEQMTESGAGALWKNVLTLKGFSQKTQTVHDLEAQLRNTIGAAQFGLANGLNPFKNTSETLDILSNQLGRKGDEGLEENYRRLQKLGVINTSVRAGDYRALLDLTEDSGVSRLTEWATQKIPKRLKNAPDDIYMAVDDTFKINAFHSELEILKKAKPRTSIDDLEEQAAEIIKNTFPNYDLVPKGIKSLRGSPFGSYFSFPSEIIRTSYHIMKQSSNEIISGNPVLIDRGVNRISGYMANQLLWANAGKASAIASGLTDEEYEAINTLAETPYSKEHNKIIFKEDDEMFLLDPAFLDSYNLFRSAAHELYTPIVRGELYGENLGRSLKESIKNTTVKLIEPYVNPTILTQAVMDVAVAEVNEGRTFKGKQIFDPDDSSLDQLLGSTTHLLKSVTPGAVQDLYELNQVAMKDRSVVNKWTGEFPTLETEALSNFTGIRFRKFNIDDAMETKVAVQKRELNSSKYKAINYQLEGDELQTDFENSLKAQKRASQDLYRNVLAYQSLSGIGAEGYKPYEIMKRLGFSQKEASGIFTGRFYPSFYSTSRMQNIAERVKGFNLDKLYKTYIEQLDTPLYADDRQRKAGGGLVEDVPRASEEPDERVDKVTGVPYDQQAGEAFVDAEDPLRRLGFVQGGLTDPLKRLGFGNGK